MGFGGKILELNNNKSKREHGNRINNSKIGSSRSPGGATYGKRPSGDESSTTENDDDWGSDSSDYSDNHDNRDNHDSFRDLRFRMRKRFEYDDDDYPEKPDHSNNTNNTNRHVSSNYKAQQCLPEMVKHITLLNLITLLLELLLSFRLQYQYNSKNNIYLL